MDSVCNRRTLRVAVCRQIRLIISIDGWFYDAIPGACCLGRRVQWAPHFAPKGLLEAPGDDLPRPFSSTPQWLGGSETCGLEACKGALMISATRVDVVRLPRISHDRALIRAAYWEDGAANSTLSPILPCPAVFDFCIRPSHATCSRFLFHSHASPSPYHAVQGCRRSLRPRLLAYCSTLLAVSLSLFTGSSSNAASTLHHFPLSHVLGQSLSV